MDLVHLRSFLAVAEHGAISEAANAVGLSQPALSRRIQLLEAEFGTALLERGRKGVVLTAMGRWVLQEAQILVERYERMKAQVRSQLAFESGVVRVGGGATAVSFILPALIAQFQRDYPGVLFQLKEAGSREVEAEVYEGDLDLGLVTLPVRARELDVVPLMKDRIVLVASEQHPLFQRASIRARDLESQSIVGFEAGTAIRQRIDQALAQAGVSVHVVMELRSIAAILEMIAMTTNLGFVSELGTQRALGIRVLPVRGLAIHRELGVVRHAHRPMSPAAKAFAERLSAYRPGATSSSIRK